MKSPSKILKLCLAQPVSVPRAGAGVMRSAVALDSQHESSRLPRVLRNEVYSKSWCAHLWN